MKRTFNDLIDFLNECNKDGIIDGLPLNRGNFKLYLAKNEYYTKYGKRILGGQRIYIEWRKQNPVPYRNVRYNNVSSTVRENRTIQNVVNRNFRTTTIPDSRSEDASNPRQLAQQKVQYKAHPTPNYNKGATSKHNNTHQDTPHDTPQDIDPSINILDNDFDFEEGDNEKIEPYIFPTGDFKILLLNDIHIPYHSLEAVRAAINYGRKEQVNAVILNGDIMDLYQMSRFSKIPNKKTIRDELELCRQFLQQLRKLFPSEKIIFKVGNHDHRLSRYIHERAPELFGVDAINLPELLKLKEYNIDYVQSSQGIQIGDLLCCHGHEWGGGGGINAARSMLLKANCNVIVGHFHRSQEYITTTANGKTLGAWIVGCLCDLSPEYLPFNNWNQGFAIVQTFTDGTFQVSNKKIIEGKVY